MQPRRSSSFKSRSKAAALALAAVVLPLQLSCDGAVRDPVPDELLGTWTTDNERYADRALQFTESSILFHTGPGKFELAGFGIVDIQVEELDNGRRTYDVGYAEETGVTRFELDYEPIREIVQLKNQPLVIWTRQAPEDPLDVEGEIPAGQ